MQQHTPELSKRNKVVETSIQNAQKHSSSDQGGEGCNIAMNLALSEPEGVQDQDSLVPTLASAASYPVQSLRAEGSAGSSSEKALDLLGPGNAPAQGSVDPVPASAACYSAQSSAAEGIAGSAMTSASVHLIEHFSALHARMFTKSE